MFSLNVPVPPAIEAYSMELRPLLLPAEHVRNRLTLVLKRLSAEDWSDFTEFDRRIRQTIHDEPPVEAAIGGIGQFESPPAGPAPVVYLRVESPGLMAIHQTLVDDIGAMGDIEGETYVPHITLARGDGCQQLVRTLENQEIPRLSWTIDRLVFYDGRRDLEIGTITLG